MALKAQTVSRRLHQQGLVISSPERQYRHQGIFVRNGALSGHVAVYVDIIGRNARKTLAEEVYQALVALGYQVTGDAYADIVIFYVNAPEELGCKCGGATFEVHETRIRHGYPAHVYRGSDVPENLTDLRQRLNAADLRAREAEQELEVEPKYSFASEGHGRYLVIAAESSQVLGRVCKTPNGLNWSAWGQPYHWGEPAKEMLPLGGPFRTRREAAGEVLIFTINEVKE